ncbi:hypothetical protein D3C71_1697560 [compost metagenome]
MFSDRFRRVGRYAHHLDIQFFGGVQIDIIKAGAAQSQNFDPQRRQFFKHFTAAVVVDEDADGFAAGGVFGGFFTEQEVEELQLVAKLLIHQFEIFTVILFGAVYRQFHRGFSRVIL